MSDGVTGNIRYVRERAQDASAERKGLIRLAGDLGGTADNPRVVSIPVEVSVSLASGGTGADLTGTGPGVLVQHEAGANVTVETLSPARGGTGVNNGTNALTVPGSGTAALRNLSNTFSASQTINANLVVTGTATIGGALNVAGLLTAESAFLVDASPGGFFVWSHASVEATAQEVLAAGTVTQAIRWWAFTHAAGADKTTTNYAVDFSGSVIEEHVHNAGSDLLTMRINANGSVDVRRTGGSASYEIVVMGMFL